MHIGEMSDGEPIELCGQMLESSLVPRDFDPIRLDGPGIQQKEQTEQQKNSDGENGPPRLAFHG